VVIVVVLVAMMAYGSSRQKDTSPLTDETATAEVEAMLTAYTLDDYQGFSAGFDDSMFEEMGADEFEEWRNPLYRLTGDFEQIIDFEEPTQPRRGTTRYVFHAAFAKDESVQVTITFDSATRAVTNFNMKTNK
jgi:hypothetical protein